MILPVLLTLAVSVLALPAGDLVSSPPGMLQTVIYSGFLSASVPSRQLHYLFVQANVSDPTTAPLVIWLNGGPGCSSLIGMLSEIGPYLVGNDYKLGDMLTKNDYSWAQVANLLFLESPAIVGFSSDTDPRYEWTDLETAQDALAALKDFLFNKAPEFAERALFITGESYAGKYIPDLTSLILDSNREGKSKYINIKGIMVGNGVMNFEDNSLEKSEIQYMIDHALVSNRLEVIYRRACEKHFSAPRCKFVRFELNILEAYLNRYNIYEVCHRSTTQGNRLMEMLYSNKSLLSNGRLHRSEDSPLGDIPDCPSDAGMIKYWNLNKIPFKVNSSSKSWTVCAHLNYSVTMRGSLKEYQKIIMNGAVKVWLFSGDFDDQVPFTDTDKNLDLMLLEKTGGWSSWSVKDQHGGFYQMYGSNLTVITVKGAGHMVPQTQPKAVFQLFSNFINGKGPNNQIF